jgi:hypothetical protein
MKDILFRIGVSADFKSEAPGLLEPFLEQVFGPFHLICDGRDYGGGGGSAGCCRQNGHPYR